MVKTKYILIIGIFIFFHEYLGFSQFSENSVLKSGIWYKIKVNETGIYKLSYSDLYDLGFSAPENIRVYGNGGRQLSYLNNDEFPDDLIEIPLYSTSASPEDFTNGDYYLFFGEGTSYWTFNVSTGEYEHGMHDYSLVNYYYVTSSFGPGKRIINSDYSGLSATVSVDEYDFLASYENENINVIKSGRTWYGNRFDNEPVEIPFAIQNIVDDEPVEVITSAIVRSDIGHTVYIRKNGSVIDELYFTKLNNINDSESIYANSNTSETSFFSNEETFAIEIELPGAKNTDLAFLDYIRIKARSRLIFDGDALFWRDSRSLGSGEIAEYNIIAQSSDIMVWDITHHNNVHRINGKYVSNNYSFKIQTDTLHEFVVLNPGGEFNSPIFEDTDHDDVGWIENQNLHALNNIELLIVTHPDFFYQASELGDWHEEKDNMRVAVVTTNQIYNEFSSGKPDASAIRNFARMLYEKEYDTSSNSSFFKYLLLFGDGSYDNRTMGNNNPNYIPTYQSENSLNPISSYTSDDLFGMLELGEFSTIGTLDIGVGRIPVKSSENQNEAQGVVDKIKLYYSENTYSDWRNKMMFVGDDGESGWDNEIFMVNSDQLTDIVKTEMPLFNINKIYLDAYQQISTSTGASYPDVEKEIKSRLEKGTLVFNYMGHGGENGMTQERVFQKTDIESLTNSPHFPLFITATCQLGRFDQVDIENGMFSTHISAGEAALLNKRGGAIALYTTTRVVFQNSNYNLSKNVYNNLFERDSLGRKLRFGDVFRLAKNLTANDNNKLKFALLGDPAIALSYGEYLVVTDSINYVPVDINPDTANALSLMTVSGYIAHADSSIINNFNGIIQISVYDKEYVVSTRSNDGIPIIDFLVQDKLLFKGKATIANGRFAASFRIPKDISYSFGKGKISYYANNDTADASGYFDNFFIGGTDDYSEFDMTGPEIDLYINDTLFEEGGITGTNPVLVARLFDRNGINITGVGIGHDIVGVLDNDANSNYIMNDYFEGNLDDFRSGYVNYPLYDLEEGYHEISLKVWDIYNNSSEKSIGFNVAGGDNLIIQRIYNFPNPFTEYTNFQYTHNIAGTHEVQIKIYDLTGRLIGSLYRKHVEQGNVSEPLYWNKKTMAGDRVQSGMYIYTIELSVTPESSDEKLKTKQNGRFIIIQ